MKKDKNYFGRTGQMTPRERVLAAFHRQQPDRVPYDLGFFNREALSRFKSATGSDNPDQYFSVEKDVEWVFFKETLLNLCERFLPYHELPKDTAIGEPDYTGQKTFKQGTFFLNEWGVGSVVGSNVAYDHIIPPAALKKATSVKVIEEYPFPDFAAPYRHMHLVQDTKQIKKSNLASVCPLEMTVFETSWQLRGLTELLMDFIVNEELAACLLDKVTAISCFSAKTYAQAGVDIIRLGDDVGMEDRMIIDPAMWRKWLKPRLACVIESARDIKPDVLISYHSDGYIEPIIPELVEIGVDILNPVQPECMDPANIKKQYGDKLAFWGGIGVQHTLPYGSSQDMEAEVKERIQTLGKDGGFYLAPTHVIAPEVPYENLFALVKAAKKYGKYPI